MNGTKERSSEFNEECVLHMFLYPVALQLKFLSCFMVSVHYYIGPAFRTNVFQLNCRSGAMERSRVEFMAHMYFYTQVEVSSVGFHSEHS